MSSSDKTGDQLASTIRKAKTGSTETTAAAKPAAPAKKAAAKKAAPAKKKTASPAAKNETESRQKADSLQLGRRVWPD
jgi:DNA-binding protein HU-beta